MSRKAKTPKKTNPLIDESQLDQPLPPETATLPKSTPKAADPTDGYTLLIENGKALKLSPKTKNHVFFQLAQKQDDQKLYLRMSGNENGGLFSKEWINVDALFELLDENKDKTIKSTVLKSLFKGGSANNCGFLAAVLRCKDIGLLTQSEKSVFVHRLSDGYDKNKEKLLGMAKTA